MANLPEDFIRDTKLLMGEVRFNRFMEALDEDAPVSIRLNPKHSPCRCEKEDNVPWCTEGYYLKGRPQFTFDPLFHAGCYYVQEASSMFVSHVMHSLITHHLSPITPQKVLDLCAAPGGKSTAIRSVLPKDCLLISNEPIHTRSQILLENITKWGWSNCIVTNNYPHDFRKSKMLFDIILCDVPCSGEGMFRKDPNTINEWSIQNVEKCWKLQREIVADAWECLSPGGILIYCTCTYNIKENEENVRWIQQTYGAEILSIPTEPEWGITGSLLKGFEEPVYRFIPGFTKGEGLFMCALRKSGQWKNNNIFPKLKVLTSELPSGNFPHVNVNYLDALKYLHGEAIILPADTPKGLVTVTYKGFALGPAKNIGNRANNLYPKAWRIKTSHLPSEEIKIIDIQ